MFTASNGVTVVERPDGRMSFNHPGVGEGVALTPRTQEALAEYFRNKEDERLGRWRWPENPEYVVYAAPRLGAQPASFDAFVVNEAVGASAEYVRAEDDGGNSIIVASAFARAARAYFDAHPEPKPWQDAKPGEVWEITFDEIFPGQRSGTAVFWVAEDDDSVGGTGFVPSESETPRIGTQAGAITAGRRIYPEAD